MEEESIKEGTEKPRGARTADKAGWIKKSSGGLLSLWKDRYLLLCQAQLLVYENEDEQKCVETVELGSYEKCQDIRTVLKRKHRFILLRSPGNKVSDIKFQASSGEEKESWIKALNEGINRGKNKAFDEVKVDKTCALEHVTRNRVRGGQRRRPPTRIHLKEGFQQWLQQKRKLFQRRGLVARTEFFKQCKERQMDLRQLGVRPQGHQYRTWCHSSKGRTEVW
nr:pleckstrin homology domain-containing family O member 2 isoform X2 [Rattus norvegicus]